MKDEVSYSGSASYQHGKVTPCVAYLPWKNKGLKSLRCMIQLWKDMVLIRAKLKASLPNYQQVRASSVKVHSTRPCQVKAS